MKRIKYLILLVLLPTLMRAQEQITMTLDQCIEMAASQSLDAFLAKNTYLADYWNFRSYKASLLPSLHLNTTPLNYYNGISQEWIDNKYTSLQNQSLNMNAEVQLQQKIGLTGGTVSIETGSSFLYNYANIYNPLDEYGFTSVPVTISFNQNLNGYNSLKWRSKIDPEKYEKAKRTYLQTREEVNIKSINYFFTLINSQINLELAERNLVNAEELYKIGKGRFEVGTITQDELLTLELDLYNSKLSKIKGEQSLLRARIDLNIFLNIDKATNINCIIPESIPGVNIEMDQAINMAMTNNSKINNLAIRDYQSESEVQQAKATNRFTSSLKVSYGLNGNEMTETDPYLDVFNNSYKNLGQKQSVSLGFSIPIIDWGEGKGAVAVAKSNREVALIEIQQELLAFEQEVSVNVLEYNLQKSQVQGSAKADTIAQKGYDISYEIFKLGKLDVIKLNQARNSQVQARKAYITSLQNYWKYWYTIRQLTLFDFENEISLSQDFDQLINVK